MGWRKDAEGVIFVKITPKVIKDFNHSKDDLLRFFSYFNEFFSFGKRIVVIWATGNSDHIFEYRGKNYQEDKVPWARYTFGGKETGDEGKKYIFSKKTLNYRQIKDIISGIKSVGMESGYPDIRVFEYLDPGNEFCENEFKYHRHPEIIAQGHVDITTYLNKDSYIYSSYPEGIPNPTKAADFGANQTGDYLTDMGMDGVFLGNALGTIGHWFPERARGYSDSEAKAILYFFQHLKETLAEKQVMWMDSYWPRPVEHDRWSVPREAYDYMDYIMISTWAVLVKPDNIQPNIDSKLGVGKMKLIYQIDYVDPWYHYNAYIHYPNQLTHNIKLLYENMQKIDGIKIVGNDENGNFVPECELKRIYDALR